MSLKYSQLMKEIFSLDMAYNLHKAPVRRLYQGISIGRICICQRYTHYVSRMGHSLRYVPFKSESQ